MRTTALLFVLAGTCAIAQNPIGLHDQAPDWTATDLNGNTYTLSDYLNDGYTVILDFSVPWCEPCDEIHQSHVLQTLYDQSGPGTSADKLMVFLISSGPEMFLHGEQGFSDWVTGTPYPIINDQSIHDLYGIVAYPRVFTICSSGLVVSNQHSTNLATMTTISESCDHLVADSPNDAAVLGGLADPCLDPNGSIHTVLYNVGSSPLTTATIEAVDCVTNEVLNTVSWTGNLPTYGSETISIPGWNATPGEHCARLRLITPDDDPENNLSAEIQYRAPVGTSATTTITVEILTDDNGADWTWFISGPDYQTAAWVQEGTYAPNTLYTETVEVTPDACWHFAIANWSSPAFGGSSYYLVKSGDEVLISEANTMQLSGGAVLHEADFASGQATAIAAQEVMEPTIGATGDQRITITGAEAGSTLLVTDAAGRRVRIERLSAANATFDLSDLNSGAYVISLLSERGRYSRTFVFTE